MPHVLHKLADAAADLLRADANDHALRLAIQRLLRLLLVRGGLPFPLAASSGHFGGSMVVLLNGVEACEGLELFCDESRNLGPGLSYRRR
jgi:hypothetical protein